MPLESEVGVTTYYCAMIPAASDLIDKRSELAYKRIPHPITILFENFFPKCELWYSVHVHITQHAAGSVKTTIGGRGQGGFGKQTFKGFFLFPEPQ